MVGAIALGEGTPIFDRKHDAALGLIDVDNRDNTENVVLRYKVTRRDR